MSSLDQIDRQLLTRLQDEGRITNVELASRVGLTAPPCLRRVRALEEAGIIRGYHADIDFILKIVARDLQEFQAFLTSKLTPAANVASVKTSLTIRTSKQQPGVPLDE
ncbi:Lrp/AsnC family transcriptional regulator [Blastomonas fulva]|uniref:HTH asnC-type domain-containing protein n=1 Tax=Blastomonas fulva TaxID=1550728 RepID=A0ABM6M7Z4_9SPHN|nr:Lrp/AsnC family transcriptional regulator [Blastomonas fulva]ASR52125.1 hypothetical protein B5J99_12190 [Blastomonas fulva]